jgi:hypothetical protein
MKVWLDPKGMHYHTDKNCPAVFPKENYHAHDLATVKRMITVYGKLYTEHDCRALIEKGEV